MFYLSIYVSMPRDLRNSIKAVIALSCLSLGYFIFFLSLSLSLSIYIYNHIKFILRYFGERESERERERERERMKQPKDKWEGAFTAFILYLRSRGIF